jgi:GT2 family glycosyltransferase
VDLCRRARDYGWSVWYDPSLRVVHHQPLHRRRVSASMRLITRHSLLTYAATDWSAWQFRILAGIVRAEGWLRGLCSLLRRDHDEAMIWREMSVLAADMSRGDEGTARRRLRRITRRFPHADGGPSSSRKHLPGSRAGWSAE